MAGTGKAGRQGARIAKKASQARQIRKSNAAKNSTRSPQKKARLEKKAVRKTTQAKRIHNKRPYRAKG